MSIGGEEMELRVLTYFLTVARERTISQAAKILHVSQPTLSKQLKELEEELGVQLFIRGNREITLTEDGVYLQNRGNEILALVTTTTENIQKNDVISGALAIGGGETQAFQWISPIVNELIKEYPDSSIHLYSGNADDVKEKIDKGLLDFGLVIDPVDKQKYDYLRLPLADHWGVLINENHPLASQPVITPDLLTDFSLLVSNQSLVDNQLSEWLGGNLEHFHVAGTYNLLYNASLLVKESTLVALCIDGIINTKENGLTFVPCSPSLTASVNVIWKKKQVFSNVAKLFLEKLKK